MTTPARFFIMRHGETVYNAAHRLQANHIHTPLTSLGFRQAMAMGEALKGALRPGAVLHVSETGRALQTAALVAEGAGLDWFAARRDLALVEIDMGSWCQRTYAEVEAEHGAIRLDDHLLRPAPDGEDYAAIEARLRRWLGSVEGEGGDHVVVMHGISSRVLRGIMAGHPVHGEHGAPIAPSLVQGSISLIEEGRETLFLGSQQGVRHA
jgi:probable phosphoglycerate mutase